MPNGGEDPVQGQSVLTHMAGRDADTLLHLHAVLYIAQFQEKKAPDPSLLSRISFAEAAKCLLVRRP